MPVKPHAIVPVLHVTDVDAAITYYVDVFGFEEKFRYEKSYAGLKSGGVEIHLTQGNGNFGHPIGGSSVYLFLDSPADVDAIYTTIVAQNGKVDKEPQNYPYGMRDFAAFDPDGNLVSFGAEVLEGAG